MALYLTFQRPPPSSISVSNVAAAAPSSSSVSASAVIRVAPLITNDLRSEPFAPLLEEADESEREGAEVYLIFAWVCARSSAGGLCSTCESSKGQNKAGNTCACTSPFAPSSSTTRVRLLKEGDGSATALRFRWTGPESAYKPVELALPSARRLRRIREEGEGLRLAVWAERDGGGSISGAEGGFRFENGNESASGAADTRKKRQKVDGGKGSTRLWVSRIKANAPSGEQAQLPNDDVLRALATPLLRRRPRLRLPPRQHILPALSQPIVLSSPTSSASSNDDVVVSSSKQDKTSRLFLLPDLIQASNAGAGGAKDRPGVLLEIVEEMGFELDKHIWDAGLELCSFLCSIFASDSNTSRSLNCRLTTGTATDVSSGDDSLRRLVRLLLYRDPLRVVELGTGTGLVSLVLASLLHQRRSRRRQEVAQRDVGEDVPAAAGPAEHGCEDFATKKLSEGTWNDPRRHEIFATDLPSALPLIEQNRSLSLNLFSPSVALRPLALNWDDDGLPPEITRPRPENGSREEGESGGEERGGLDLVLVSDCTYNPSSFSALLSTLRELLLLGSSEGRRLQIGTRDGTRTGDQTVEGTLALLAKKRRHEDEEALWRMIEEAGMKAVRVSGYEHLQQDDETAKGYGEGAPAADTGEMEGALSIWAITLARNQGAN